MTTKAITNKNVATQSATPKPAPSKAARNSSGSYDWGLITIVATLVTLGAIMVFSASYTVGIYVHDDPFYFFFRQLIWLGLGITAMLFTMRIPYGFWQRWSVLLMVGAFLALLAVIVLGIEILGSTRTLFSGSVLPAEPAQNIIII